MEKQRKFSSAYFLLLGLFLQTSCHTLEKASSHGFNSGFYTWDAGSKKSSKVYLDIKEDKVEVYEYQGGYLGTEPVMNLPLEPSDSLVYKS